MAKIFIAGGGTGGHVYPGVAVAEELRRKHPDWEIAFVGTLKGMESRILPETGFHLHLITASGLPRRPGFGHIMFGINFLKGLGQARALLQRERPNVVLATGGYVSAPVVVAARMLKIPVLLQEQNSIPGLANRWLSGMADEVHLNFSESRQYFKRRNHLKLTGNPVRAEVLSGIPRESVEKYGLDPNLFTVFVFGGSRGAHSINQAVMDAWPILSQDPGLQLIVQTGSEDIDLVKSKVSGPRTLVRDYLTHISEAYCVADLVVGRAGAMTLSELTACGLPSILVPYPHAAQNHQLVNAKNLEERGAATVILDEDLTGKRLADEIQKLKADRGRLKTMAKNARTFGRPDAAEKIVRSLERYAPGMEIETVEG